VFALALVRLALQAVVSVVPARLEADIVTRLRAELFAAFVNASWAEEARDREGHLQELLGDQAHHAMMVALNATTILAAALTFVVLIITALAVNFVAALTVLVASMGLFVLLRPLSTLGNRRGEALSWAKLNYATGIGQAVRLAEEVKVFGTAGAQHKRVDRLVADMRRPIFHTQLLTRLVPSLYQSLIFLLVAVGLGVVYWTGTSHVASLGAVILLLVRAGTYGQMIQGGYQGMQQMLPDLERMQEAQSRYAASTPPAGQQPLERVRTLVFERVGYAYEPGRPVLFGIGFEIAGGEAIGIVGPSGAGKSTLVQILLGLRFPDSGRYLINGVPADEFSPSDWHRLVAYVPQEPRLLHASVAENIRFFRDLSDDAVRQAARLAGVHDEVMAWPDGYDTIVGPRADAVSGGQQQRICLARALVAKPEMLVLDEPTSALDPRSEERIRESLLALRHELTLFVVAHRMSTLDICERVMVIIDGRLEAFGTAEGLRSSNAYYRSAAALAVGSAADR
jgi:ABC-type multidrug transport system fused ATPase/permease subunit